MLQSDLFFGNIQSSFLDSPVSPAKGTVLSTLGQVLPHKSLRQFSIHIATGQSDGSISSSEIPPSQVTLVCIKLTAETNEGSTILPIIRQRNRNSHLVKKKSVNSTPELLVKK